MILVTGGTGLLGSHLLYLLSSSGKKVRAIKRPCSNTNSVKKIFAYYSANAEELFQKIEWLEGDVLDIYSLIEAMEGVDHVYHCAAEVSFSGKEIESMKKINVEGTANVVNACLDRNLKKLCHVSSIAALGKTSTKQITEDTPWKTNYKVSKYSLSKYSAEREAWRGIAEGLNVIIVNPSVIIGPGNWNKGSSNMFTGSFKGIKYYTEGSTGFVDVRDVAKAMVKLMESEIKNERFIISGENSKYKDFFDLVHDNFEKPKPSIQAGKLLSDFAWIASKLSSYLTGKSPLITKETARAAHNQHHFSNEKIKEALGFEFIPLSKTVKETCEFFLKDLQKS